MVRLFHVYYPVRTLVLLGGEALVIGASFVLATILLFGQDAVLILEYEGGGLKILAVVGVCVMFSYYFDLYAPERLSSRGEIYFRLLIMMGVFAFVLAGIRYLFPEFSLGQNVFLSGMAILTFGLLLWRGAYNWLVAQPYFRERIYVLGGGERATRLVEAIRARNDLGMEVVGWGGAIAGDELDRAELGSMLTSVRGEAPVDRIIVAMADRRGRMPVRELLALRLSGTKIEDATTLLEKISGRIELAELHPSSLIFCEGFRLNQGALLLRRAVSILASSLALLILLPIIPLIALAVKLSSPGPVLFRQERVGRRGLPFTLCKFRTMRADAEQLTGAVWAQKDDPRITKVGKFLRKTRLDEIPQLWNVLRGDMGFVGPRPERPEFVQWLTEAIPYYGLRHIIRPGVTGWAQIRYQYGASLEETREKLQYDLYYIKHMCLSLDLLIMFETVKTILLRRGAQ